MPQKIAATAAFFALMTGLRYLLMSRPGTGARNGGYRLFYISLVASVVMSLLFTAALTLVMRLLR